MKCPRCGMGRLFESWNTLNGHCPACGLTLERGAGDTWAFMYITTAGMTGLIIAAMLLFKPANLWLGRLTVGIVAVGAIVLTLPVRKGMAVAVDYLAERATEDPQRIATHSDHRPE